MFDPYRLYTRRKRRSEKGQVLRKKPSNLTGSVSDKDLPLLMQMADALGYKLEKPVFPPPPPPPGPPPPIPPPPPPAPSYFEQTYFRSKICKYENTLGTFEPTHTLQFLFDFQEFERKLHISDLFNVDLSENVQLQSLTVDVFINNFIIRSTRGSDNMLLSYETPHGKGYVEYNTLNYPPLPDESFNVSGFSSSAEDQYLISNEPPYKHYRPWDTIPQEDAKGLFDRIIFKWNGPDALRYYYGFKFHIPDALYSLGPIYKHELMFAETSNWEVYHIELNLEFFVTIVTNEKL